VVLHFERDFGGAEQAADVVGARAEAAGVADDTSDGSALAGEIVDQFQVARRAVPDAKGDAYQRVPDLAVRPPRSAGGSDNGLAGRQCAGPIVEEQGAR